MAGALAKREVVVAVVPALAMANRFGRYKPETERTVRKVEVVENETLEKLKEVWKAIPSKDRYWDRYYGDVAKRVSWIRYSVSDVENFSLAIAGFQGDENFGYKAGMFLSALVNVGMLYDYVVHTVHLEIAPYALGYENIKRVTVDGDVNYMLGWDMKCGEIAVTGNARGMIGEGLKGGRIRICGDAGDQIGEWMLGGEIWLESAMGSIHNVQGGKIFHKGELIFPR
ncbi:MAG: hypothetical protein PHF60_02350 [Candidatus ainarchaeum sp.]|nr:hypothetical protein [Candidatus ainarchaeum sp.]